MEYNECSRYETIYATWVPKIVQSVLKRKFCISSHVEGLQNAAKYS
jgi:hypothetical protein